MGKSSHNQADLVADAAQALSAAPIYNEWTRALTAVARVAGGWGCCVSTLSPRVGFSLSLTAGLSQDLLQRFIAFGGHQPDINPRARALYAAAPGVIASEKNFTPESEWRRSQYYQDFCLPSDTPHSAFAKL